MKMFVASLFAFSAAASDLPAFSFREHNTVQTYNTESLYDAGCKDTEQGIYCSFQDRIVGQFVVMSYLVVDRRLSVFRFSGFRDSLPEVLPALVERDGRPCEAGTDTVRNKLGREFPVTTLTWCFATGKLTLRDRDGRIDSFSAEYRDDVIRPPKRDVRPDF